MKKLSILAIFAVIAFASCSTGTTTKEEKTPQDSTKTVEAVDTAATQVDTTAAEH